MKSYEEKKADLYRRLEKYTEKNLCVAFSGGTDSSLLLKAVKEVQKNMGRDTEIYGVTFDTLLHPPCDLKIAGKVAEEIGAVHKILRINELEQKKIQNNPPDRCYHCKKNLFQKLREFAASVNAEYILEGTNADDRKAYRPGLRAIQELGILSPLADAGFTKEQVRRLAAELGISVAGRPSSPCLATRLPYGTRIDIKILEQIARGEEYLKREGFETIRLRLHGDVARIEIPEIDFERFLKKAGIHGKVLKKLGFSYVSLDLLGFRSGSMDEKLKIEKI